LREAATVKTETNSRGPRPFTCVGRCLLTASQHPRPVAPTSACLRGVVFGGGSDVFADPIRFKSDSVSAASQRNR
jgi:hypothetical protein